MDAIHVAHNSGVRCVGVRMQVNGARREQRACDPIKFKTGTMEESARRTF